LGLVGLGTVGERHRAGVGTVGTRSKASTISASILETHTQLAYDLTMKAIFVELPAFEKHRAEHFDDENFRRLQAALMANPEAGEVIEGTGGLRKVRFADRQRGKGKRGGLRVIYYWWGAGSQFWLFTVYGKGEVEDLTSYERKRLKVMIKAELEARRKG
jgi:hypothetical protein